MRGNELWVMNSGSFDLGFGIEKFDRMIFGLRVASYGLRIKGCELRVAGCGLENG